MEGMDGYKSLYIRTEFTENKHHIIPQSNRGYGRDQQHHGHGLRASNAPPLNQYPASIQLPLLYTSHPQQR